MPKFEIITGQHAHQEFDIAKARVWIGSDKRCEIFLKEPGISRFHAEVFQDQQGKFWARDAGGSFGTLLNGTDIDHATIQTGDVLTLGRVKMRFLSAPSAKALPASPHQSQIFVSQEFAQPAAFRDPPPVSPPATPAPAGKQKEEPTQSLAVEDLLEENNPPFADERTPPDGGAFADERTPTEAPNLAAPAIPQAPLSSPFADEMTPPDGGAFADELTPAQAPHTFLVEADEVLDPGEAEPEEEAEDPGEKTFPLQDLRSPIPPPPPEIAGPTKNPPSPGSPSPEAPLPSPGAPSPFVNVSLPPRPAPVVDPHKETLQHVIEDQNIKLSPSEIGELLGIQSSWQERSYSSRTRSGAFNVEIRRLRKLLEEREEQLVQYMKQPPADNPPSTQVYQEENQRLRHQISAYETAAQENEALLVELETAAVQVEALQKENLALKKQLTQYTALLKEHQLID